MYTQAYIDKARLEKPHLKNFKPITFIFNMIEIPVTKRGTCKKQKFPIIPSEHKLHCNKHNLHSSILLRLIVWE